MQKQNMRPKKIVRLSNKTTAKLDGWPVKTEQHQTHVTRQAMDMFPGQKSKSIPR